MSNQLNAGSFQTIYESREKKGIKLEFSSKSQDFIENHLGMIEEMKKFYDSNEIIKKALNDLKAKSNALLLSNLSEEKILNGLIKIRNIQDENGRRIDISSFQKGKGEQIADKTKFVEKTNKRIHQTACNLLALLQWRSDQKELKILFDKVKVIEKKNLPVSELDSAIKSLIATNEFSVYQKVKNEYIQSWLKPFEKELGKSVESLTPEEVQNSVKRMKLMMKQKMKEGSLRVCSDSSKYEAFNQLDHKMANGSDVTFWQNVELLDEFIRFVQEVLQKFTFLLDKQFVVFEFKSEPTKYLIGFSQEALLNLEKSSEGDFVLTPHIKVLMPSEGSSYRELTGEKFESLGLYMDVLKDAMKPFLIALGEKVSFEYSKEFKQLFKF